MTKKEIFEQITVYPTKRNLIMLCGPPYSGKSTLAQQISALQPARWVIISRKQNDFKSRFDLLLKVNVSIILDACHSTKKTREKITALIPKGFWKIVIVIDAPLVTVLARQRQDRTLLVIQRQRAWKKFQEEKPDVEELRKLGFNQIFFLTEF